MILRNGSSAGDRTFTLLEVGAVVAILAHLAKAVGVDEVSVRVAGICDPEPRLRADTLMAAFAARPIP